jgi:hypothetical protein
MTQNETPPNSNESSREKLDALNQQLMQQSDTNIPDKTPPSLSPQDLSTLQNNLSGLLKAFLVGNVTQYCLDKYAKGNRIIGHIYQLEREGQELIVKAHPERKKDSTEEKQEILRLIQVRTKTGEPQLYLLHSKLIESDWQHLESVQQQLNKELAQRQTQLKSKTQTKSVPKKRKQLEL